MAKSLQEKSVCLVLGMAHSDPFGGFTGDLDSYAEPMLNAAGF